MSAPFRSAAAGVVLSFASVCSGIGAPEIAWHELGWKSVFVSEIDKFPSAVLKHRFPHVPNLGDMRRYEEWPDAALDVLVGGTPCQDFSVAGLRAGLAGDRANLALVYLEIARRYRPRWLVWENVPGVFSSLSHDAPDPSPPPPPLDLGCDGAEVETEDDYDAEELHAFQCMLAGFSGIGYGVVYRVLDAQYAGVPQRRRRVFAVGYLGDWRPAAAVLLEHESLLGNPPPRREARQGAAGALGGGPDGGRLAGTVSAKWAKGAGGPAGDEAYNLVAGAIDANHGNVRAEQAWTDRLIAPAVTTRVQGDRDSTEGHLVAGTLSAGMGSRGGKGGNNAEEHFLVAAPLTAGAGRGSGGRAPGLNAEGAAGGHLVASTMLAGGPGGVSTDSVPLVTHTLTGEGHDAMEDGTGRGVPLVAVPFDSTQITNKDNRSQPKAGDPCHPLTGTGHPPAIAYRTSANNGAWETGDKADALTTGTDRTSHLLTVPEPIAFDARQSDVHVHGDKTGAVDTKFPGPAIAFAGRERGDDGRGYAREAAFNEERTGALDTVKPPRVVMRSQVRRLTPKECERLQGMPDDWTRIPMRRYRRRKITKTRPRDRWEKVEGGWALMAADGPRYKAVGNSMAVPEMRWIGQRIQLVESILREMGR